jgi:hypothetical protein
MRTERMNPNLDSTKRSHRRGAETLRNTEKLGVQERELNFICDEVGEGAGNTQSSFRTLRLRAFAVRVSVTSRLTALLFLGSVLSPAS